MFFVCGGGDKAGSIWNSLKDFKIKVKTSGTVPPHRKRKKNNRSDSNELLKLKNTCCPTRRWALLWLDVVCLCCGLLTVLIAYHLCSVWIMPEGVYAPLFKIKVTDFCNKLWCYLFILIYTTSVHDQQVIIWACIANTMVQKALRRLRMLFETLSCFYVVVFSG